MHLSAGPLENRFVRLVAFNVDSHGENLRTVTAALGDSIATWPYYNPPGDWVGAWLENISARQAAGTLLPFAVLTPEGTFAGMTSYLSPDAASRHVEIGMTIYSRHVQGGAVNPACKHLLLSHAFERGALRVRFNVDTRNGRSQAAVLKLGAQKEGILRDDRILPNGYLRSTAVFSILAREWPGVKERLETRLSGFG